MSPEAEALINTYNRLASIVGRTANRRGFGIVGLVSRTAKTAEIAESLAAELTRREWPLGPFLAACFAKHSWAYHPKLQNLQSKRYLDYFEEHRKDAHHWWWNLEQTRRAETREETTPSPGTEIIKQRLLASGGPSLCMAQQSLTGGYNSKSKPCSTCRGQNVCTGSAESTYPHRAAL